MVLLRSSGAFGGMHVKLANGQARHNLQLAVCAPSPGRLWLIEGSGVADQVVIGCRALWVHKPKGARLKAGCPGRAMTTIIVCRFAVEGASSYGLLASLTSRLLA